MYPEEAKSGGGILAGNTRRDYDGATEPPASNSAESLSRTADRVERLVDRIETLLGQIAGGGLNKINKAETGAPRPVPLLANMLEHAPNHIANQCDRGSKLIEEIRATLRL